jgi:hypothetical protein
VAAHPAYYAEVEGGIYTDSSNVAVRSTATGAVVATVPDPVDANHRKLFAIDVTTRDDGTFYAIYSENKSHGDGDFVIYTFKVTSAGTVTGLAAIKGGQITGQRYLGNDGGFTVSPDGSEVAVAVAASSTGSVRSALPQRVLVIDLLTGARTVWRGGGRPTASRWSTWPSGVRRGAARKA